MAYYDKKRDRVLMRNGVSVISPLQFAKNIVEGRENKSHVLLSVDSDIYKELYGTSVGVEIEEIDFSPKVEQTEDDLDFLITTIQDSPRYKEQYDDRIEHELDFFWRSGNIRFLIKIHELINKFKEDNVVWGVGRGSGSSSLILYVLEVHDINPLEFDLNFSELSKE